MLVPSRSLQMFGSPMLRGALSSPADPLAAKRPMAIPKVVSITVFLLGLSLLSGLLLWFFFPMESGVNFVRNFGFGAGVFAFSMALIASVRPQWSSWLAPLYSIAGGLFMAGLARALEVRFPGIAMQTLAISAGVFVVMLLLYVTGLLRATPRFRLVVYVATAGIAMVYLLALLLSLAGLPLAWLGQGGLGAALWYGFVATIAALNLVLDYERIDNLRRVPQPDYVHWYAALGLMVTLVWLYISVLRLLASVRR
jgi:uncharacterized YccA/Bax inhibitor family protein